MSQILNVRFSGGYVSTGTGGRDASDLDAGELQTMTGAYYRKDDPHQAWKMPGRTLFGTTEADRVDGIAVCQFDEDGADKILAAVGTKLYGATPGTSGTFTVLSSGLSSEAETFVAAHQEDRWYLCNGVDENRVLMPDGTVRLMGMKPPAEAPTCAPSGSIGETVFRPTSNTAIASVAPELMEYGPSGFSNASRAYDGDTSTFASAVTPPDSHPSDPAQNYFSHKFYGFPANSAIGRVLKIQFSGNMGASLHDPHFGHVPVRFIPGTEIRLEKSEDGGVTWEEIYRRVGSSGSGAIPEQTLESAITIDNSLIQVRAYTTSEYQGTAINIHDIRIEVGSDVVTTTTDGIFYCTTEYFDADDLESPPSPFSNIVELDDQGSVIVTRPPVVNPAATHWFVYRVGDGVANTYDNAGQIGGPIAIADATWTDTLEVAVTEQGTPVIAMISVAGEPSDFRDNPPIPFVSMISWKGSICGISLGSPRSWFYSEGGRPESFPTIYQVSSFPLDENDRLVGHMAVGESLVFLCEGACLAIDDVPRVTDGVYNPTDARPLKGHPGCVGIYAYCTWSVAGEPRGAWVSPHGVYVTNGTICACISTDLAWTREVNVPFLSTSVLKWDANNLILWFQFDYDGDGNNDREMAFHMAEAHAKPGEKHKINQPTEKATSCMAFALVDSAYLRYSGHPSNGEVYLEDSGTEDAATSEEVEMVVRSGQISNNKVNLAIVKATVAHSDFGDGETGTIIATAYRDSSNSQNSREQSVRLDGNRGTTVGIGRAGELIDIEVSYSGPGIGGIGGAQLEIDGQGRSGSAPRVTSSSVTP